jgi:hypothetical protein
VIQSPLTKWQGLLMAKVVGPAIANKRPDTFDVW